MTGLPDRYTTKMESNKGEFSIVIQTACKKNWSNVYLIIHIIATVLLGNWVWMISGSCKMSTFQPSPNEKNICRLTIHKLCSHTFSHLINFTFLFFSWQVQHFKGQLEGKQRECAERTEGLRVPEGGGAAGGLRAAPAWVKVQALPWLCSVISHNVQKFP